MRKIFLVMLIVFAGVSLVIAQDEGVPEPLPTNELFVWLEAIGSILEEQSENWYISTITNSATNTYVSWFDGCCLGLIVMEELRFCCERQISNYFSYEQDMLPYYEFILVNQTPYEVVTMCEVDGIRVHEFVGTSNDYGYYIRHFHSLDGSVATNTGLYFTEYSELEYYSQLIFPDVACADEPSPEATQEAGM